jgi:hypothetical protein
MEKENMMEELALEEMKSKTLEGEDVMKDMAFGEEIEEGMGAEFKDDVPVGMGEFVNDREEVQEWKYRTFNIDGEKIYTSQFEAFISRGGLKIEDTEDFHFAEDIYEDMRKRGKNVDEYYNLMMTEKEHTYNEHEYIWIQEYIIIYCQDFKDYYQGISYQYLNIIDNDFSRRNILEHLVDDKEQRVLGKLDYLEEIIAFLEKYFVKKEP